MVFRLVLHMMLVTGPSSYALGVLAAAIAAGAQIAFREFFLQVPFLLFFPATILAAFIGGWRAGLTCVGIATPVAAYFFLGAPGQAAINMEDWLRLLIFVLICLLIVGLLWSLQTVSQQLFGERELVRLLAREGNHRIGNSLQLVAAALQLQAGATENEEVKQALTAARNRVSAIARVHRRLHQGHPAATLPIGLYLTELCKEIEAQAGESASVKIECTNFELPVDKAVKLGLILNELLLNAVKHGVKEEVQVSCRHTGGDFTLTVSDPGPGFPPGIDPVSGKGLGMMLISTLTKEMDGKADFNRNDGRTTITITVPNGSPGK